MDISPQRVRTAEFKITKKGLDPDEVRTFLNEVAAELERAQNQSTAMEARARAAVARLQEISEATPPAPAEPAPAVAPVAAPADEIAPSVDQSETISRTLLLAQRTADTAIAEAEAEAARLRAEADAEATRAIEGAREMSDRLTAEARDEARRQGDAERIQVESEVNALLARRDFLESDVDHLQTFLVDERTRLREAASEIMELVERVPAGLGEVRRPLLSASDDDDVVGQTVADDTAAEQPADTGVAADLAESIADEGDAADDSADRTAEDVNRTVADVGTTQMPVVTASDDAADGDDDDDDDDDAGLRLDLGTDRPAPAAERERLIIQTDISDEGPTGFSYDDQSR